MGSNNFWTDANYTPLQQFRYDVETNLYKADFSDIGDDGRVKILGVKQLNPWISRELVKAVNLPDVTFGYDNDAANIGSGGPNIESQDPQMSELELQLYMTAELASNIQDIFRTYYLQDVRQTQRTTFNGKVPRILNKDRISLQPSALLLQNSSIIVNVYNPSPNASKAAPATPAKSLRYYGVYPISYSLGSMDYGSSDVVVGNIKFYFYGVDIHDGGGDTPSKIEENLLKGLITKGDKCMGNF